ncbi:hypothetical protein [Deinococcus soli (ex Cha et al. 2016)]|uniref:Uncharacterized protein n=2 Tax=Deinococcus soli (ex Cha et al. 2016) TaxID=1309411 RepID=A0ACC6KL23_9DEIO|nr:hypothetical protein [Deinococcus soli (ex Cha et al. 2016)]MDR6218698.1 hypothetical protein [Deinococcus soli (ex Cha et al. 2016)]MDR6328495.1 hypothetical protein [Deinococcus soli (ex Cha et al. 2016)]MDR6753106.1 hypothetical protein [Deinococcus soli (ex Cha et al. 2016)]
MRRLPLTVPLHVSLRVAVTAALFTPHVPDRAPRAGELLRRAPTLASALSDAAHEPPAPPSGPWAQVILPGAWHPACEADVLRRLDRSARTGAASLNAWTGPDRYLPVTAWSAPLTARGALRRPGGNVLILPPWTTVLIDHRPTPVRILNRVRLPRHDEALTVLLSSGCTQTLLSSHAGWYVPAPAELDDLRRRYPQALRA